MCSTLVSNGKLRYLICTFFALTGQKINVTNVYQREFEEYGSKMCVSDVVVLK